MMNAVLGPDAATKCIADCLMRGKVACGTRFMKPQDGWVSDASKLTRFGLAMVRDLGPEVLRWRTPCVGTYRDVGDLVCKV